MIYTLLAPDPTFTGKCSGIEFVDGIGLCDSDFMAGWLCAKGFAIASKEDKQIEAPPIPDNLDDMSCDELVSLARAYSVPLTGTRHGDKKAIITAINEAVRKNE